MGLPGDFKITRSSQDPKNGKTERSESAPMEQRQKRDSYGTPPTPTVTEPQSSDSSITRITFEDILDKLGSTSSINCTDLGENETIALTTEQIDSLEHSTDGNEDASHTTEMSLSTSASSIFTSTGSSKSLLDEFQDMFNYPFKYETMVDEWDLKCDRAWIPAIFTSCMMAGMIFGSLLSGQMTDWYGRRRTYLIVLVFMGIGTVISGMSPSVYFYAFARFLSGAAACGVINVSCMAVMEFMTPKWRSVANCVGPMGEGIMLLSLLGYFIRPWRMLYLATLAPYILIIPIYLYLPESPRWLLRNNRMKEAYNVLGYMAKINGKEPISMDLLEALRKQEELASASQGQKRISYIDFIKNRPLLITALYLCAIWFSWNVAYYGISYNIRNVPGDIYVNTALIGLANAVGKRASFLVCDRLGRRRAVLASMSFSASFLVTLAICFLVLEQVSHYLILVGCFCGLLGMACCRASAHLLSGESFPTAVRTMGLGLSGLGADVAGLLTPQLAYLGSKWPALPFFVFAGVAVVGSLVVFMMKETNGNPLSDEVELCDSKGKKNNNGV